MHRGITRKRAGRLEKEIEEKKRKNKKLKVLLAV